MRRLPYLIYVSQWVVFAVRGLLWIAFSIVEFVSKPGTRKLVPIALLALVIWQWHDIYETGRQLDQLELTARRPPTIINVAIFAALVLGGYYVLSRFLALLLGVFPPVRRPIFPTAPIVVAAKLDEAVPVRIAVSRPVNRR